MVYPRRLILLLTSLLAGAVLTACAATGERIGATVGEGETRVVATTNFVTDLVRQVGGNRVTVDGLLGPGVDPHLYKASAGDVTRLREADAVFYNGLYLEAKMQEVFEEVGGHKPVIAVTEGIPREELLAPPAGAAPEEEFDPHVWFDVRLWKHAVIAVRDGLIEIDPEGEQYYTANAEEYLRELDRLDGEVARKVAGIPRRQRVLVTSHDAFRYLGERYGIEVAAIQGLSTSAEATTADIERIAALIADRGINAVFIESSVPPQTIDAVLASARDRGQTATVGGELYSDSAGELGTPEGTYIGMVRSNVDKIVGGLR